MIPPQDILKTLDDARRSLHDATAQLSASQTGAKTDNLMYLGQALGAIKMVESSLRFQAGTSVTNV